MTAASDLKQNDAASDIARRGMEWLRKHPTLRALHDGEDQIFVLDKPDESPTQVYYLPMLSISEPIRFGYIITREGFKRPSIAAVAPFDVDGGWVHLICAVCDHVSDPDTVLAPHVAETNLIHEATHVLDFMRTGYKPTPFDLTHMENLQSMYYNRPHEFNAFFHQGLRNFLNDIELIKAKARNLERINALDYNSYVSRMIFSGAYWDHHFCQLLNMRYRRKLLRRVCRLLVERPLPGAHTRKLRRPFQA